MRSLRVADLKRLRVAWKRAKAFVVTVDHNPDLRLLVHENLSLQLEPQAKQLLLFDIRQSVGSGEL
jgi:predicted DNA-binding helix-hairpin-helix protein